MLEPPATKIAETFMSASCFTQVKRSITPDESVLLSTRPSVLLWSNFITSPMSFLELAPTSWMVSSINVEISSFKVIEEKYKIPKLFFHLPNHFWVHKNHELVVEAVNLLNKRNINLNIVCTGNTFDYRKPEFFNEFLKSLKNKKLEKQFFILGVLPYSDVISLMKSSIAVINPSLF